MYFPKDRVFEDDYFGLVLICIADKVAVLNGHVYIYSRRPESIMNTLTVRASYDIVANHRALIDFMRHELNPSDYPWFELYCCKQLVKSYSFNSRYFGSSAFNQFLFKNRFYVWKQWKNTHLKTSGRAYLGRFFYYMMPAMRQHLYLMIGKQSSSGIKIPV